MRAIQISFCGKQTDVLEFVDIPEPSPPDAGQVLIGVEFAPVNHNDLCSFEGRSTTSPHFRHSSAMRVSAASSQSGQMLQI
jgi:NADPH:quinone reductase-like Zn-dependent oxidoreductase